MENTVLTWLEEAAEKYPDKKVYMDPEKSLTFSEVMNRAKAVGSYLIKQDIDDKPVAVMLPRKVETIAAFLGVVYSGRAYAPVGLDIPEDRKEKILKRLDPSFILDEENVSEAFGTPVDDEAIQRVREKAALSDPLYIIFTSGSSGDPKGVITSHLSLMNYISAYAEMMGIGREDVMASQSPLDYIAAIRDIYVPLLTGASDVLIPKEYFMQPDRLFDMMNEYAVTAVGWSTSAITVLTKLKAFKDKTLDSLRKICFSGSVMPGAVLRQWQEALPEAVFVNQYGPTETTASCTYYKIDHVVNDDEVIPIGKPYRNYKVFLLSDDNRPVKTGEEGEIIVSGVGVTCGYINDPERTGRSFTLNPLENSFEERIYRTGDIGIMREDGNLEYHGRRDRQIKYMGHRVELDEIEAAAASFGVTESAALYQEDKEQIWFFCVSDMTIKDVSLKLREKLPGFMVPRKIRLMDELPHLPNGKTDFTTLKSMI